MLNGTDDSTAGLSEATPEVLRIGLLSLSTTEALADDNGSCCKNALVLRQTDVTVDALVKAVAPMTVMISIKQARKIIAASKSGQGRWLNQNRCAS